MSQVVSPEDIFTPRGSVYIAKASLMSGKAVGRFRKGDGGRIHKRKAAVLEHNPVTAALLSDHDELQQLRAWKLALLAPLDGAQTFDMEHADEKVELARQLWLGGYAKSLLALRAANAEYVQVIEAQVSNQYDRKASEEHTATKERLVDGILMCTSRAQSKFNMPLVTAALTVLSNADSVPVDFHEAVRRFFNGALATPNWCASLMVEARKVRPPPDEDPLPHIAIAVFDNLSMKLDYGSYVTGGVGGELKHMTNWFHVSPPRHLAPPTFVARDIFAGGMFRKDLSLTSFSRRFYLDSPDVLANRSARWGRFMHAIQNGRHLTRPAVKPTWKPRKVYERPIFDRLQSSYEDVRFEMNTIRNKFPHLKFVFIAGDGLSLMRMNHLLAMEPEMYIHSSPAAIPVQGEHPHGVFHGMHCMWRLYRRFIMKCADVLQNRQIKEDPGVSEFNVSRFFMLNILTPACAEYIHELCEDPAAEDWEDPGPFMAKAAANINFNWLCHFLHDGAFWVLDFLQSVRGNESKKLDTLWCEFFASAHSGTAHKTQYVGMSIMRVFWGCAMVPDLDALYHKIRTMPSGDHDGCGVGWDWAIEVFNHAIKSHVDTHVSEAQINNFVEDWAFVETVSAHLREIIYSNRADRHWRGRNVRADIEELKAFFRQSIGRTWAEATRPTSGLTVTRGADRSMPPWEEVSRVMRRTGDDAPHIYIRNYVDRLTPYFDWQN